MKSISKLAALAIVLLLGANVNAQLIVRQLDVLEATPKETIGPYIVVDKEKPVQQLRVAHATWDTVVPRDRLRISVTDKDRKPVPFINLEDDGIVITKPGQFWLEVKGTFFDKEKLDFFEFDETAVFTLEELLPTPAPGPGPTPPGPGPTPTPTPDIKIDGLSVLIVYESAQLPTYSQAHRSVIQSTDLRNWMNLNVSVDKQNFPNWRVLDKDTKFPATCDLVWCKWLAQPPPQLPYLIIGNKDQIVFQGPLPESTQTVQAIISKHKK